MFQEVPKLLAAHCFRDQRDLKISGEVGGMLTKRDGLLSPHVFNDVLLISASSVSFSGRTCVYVRVHLWYPYRPNIGKNMLL